jgi:hypothetical protein
LVPLRTGKYFLLAQKKDRFMKKLLMVFMAVLFGHIAEGQDLIRIPFGSTPNIDGLISIAEWGDADSVSISIAGGTKKVGVLFKHDSTNLHIAYLGHLESSMIRFPELTLDVNNSKSIGWEADDWWFHVSATDCEYQGASDNYSNCQVVRPNWTAVPNITSGAPFTDTIEIQIPLSTVNIDIASIDTIGISFVVSNTISIIEQWPASSNIGSPATWANAVFLPKATSSLIEAKKQSPIIDLFPNPSKGLVHLKVSEIKEPFDIKVVDVFGKVVFLQHYDGVLPHRDVRIDLGNERASVYMLQLVSEQGIHTQRLMIQ